MGLVQPRSGESSRIYLLFGRERTKRDFPGFGRSPRCGSQTQRFTQKVDVRARCVRRCLQSVEQGMIGSPTWLRRSRFTQRHKKIYS